MHVRMRTHTHLAHTHMDTERHITTEMSFSYLRAVEDAQVGINELNCLEKEKCVPLG